MFIIRYMERRNAEAIGYGLVGAVCIAVGFLLGSASSYDNKSRVYQRESEKPAVMRVYRNGFDDLYVQDSEDKNRFIQVNKYLDGIKDKTDKDVEEAEIKRAAEWYK